MTNVETFLKELYKDDILSGDPKTDSDAHTFELLARICFDRAYRAGLNDGKYLGDEARRLRLEHAIAPMVNPDQYL